MATDTFKTIAGTALWDVAMNWSTGALPGTSDDVVINAPASGNSTVTIATTDPAYTVNSLSETGTGANGMVDLVAVNGNLTVIGATTIASADLFVQNGGRLTLNTATLSNFGNIQVGTYGTNGGGTLLANSVAGSGFGEFLVYSGSATVGTITGGFDVVLYSGGSLAIGGTSGNNSFILQGGALSDSTTATSLADDLEVVRASTLDITSLAYQVGETVQVTANTGGTVQTYTATIRSAAGATLFTLNNVQPGSAGAVPLVSTTRDSSGGTLVSLACFTPGTLIQTPDGEVAAGDLRIGDLVTTVQGSAKPILWIGRRSYAGRFLARQRHLLPIRIGAGALGDGLPRRDLLVSPCHAMFLDGVLVPAGSLVNGTTIRQEAGADRVDYLHLELADHDLVLAEGAASETFVDDDSRNAFHNASEYHALYPDAPAREAVFCAPRLTDGHAVEAIRSRLVCVTAGVRRAA